MMRSAVDLPQPEGPSSETNSRSRDIEGGIRKATTPFGKILLTPRSETMGAAGERGIDGYIFRKPAR